MSEPGPFDEQLALVPERTRAAAKRRAPRPPPAPAAVDPIAQVLVDVPLAHLDRPFEYVVPEPMAATAVPGARVRVRFAGQDLDGYVIARTSVAEHPGTLAALRRVVSPEPVLSPELLALCRAVAQRWAGSLPDVLRLAIPPRHAEAEKAPAAPAPAPPARPAPGPWAHYPAGLAFLDRLIAGDAPRAAWAALPGQSAGSGAQASKGQAGSEQASSQPSGWPRAVATAVATALSAGRGALVVLPDHRDVARVDSALSALVGAGQHVVLSADLGPRARYAAWLAAARGQVRAVVGTRAAMFAPVRELGLVVCWDDGDDLHAEPHAPYPHVREVLVLRAELSAAAALLGGHARTAEVERLVATGWARPLDPTRASVRQRMPRMLLAGEGSEPERDPAAGSARLPSLAWRAAQAGLREGPVLVQVPRRGYVPGLACAHCRLPGRCTHCQGPLTLAAARSAPTCRWCGTTDAAWACPSCGERRLRSTVVGDRRTAEELGRAFPGTSVRTSGAGQVLDCVPARPALVVATPGAEPVAEGGYAAALLLDGWALLDRADLRAGEEALRRWMNAAALVRDAASGGVVVLVAPSALAPVEALLRWAPQWHAQRELAEREALAFPPARTLFSLTGPRTAVDSLVAASDLPASVERLGPVPAPLPTAPTPSASPVPSAQQAQRRDGDDDQPRVRLLLRARPDDGARLAAALRAGQGVRSARKDPGSVKVQRDPLELG